MDNGERWGRVGAQLLCNKASIAHNPQIYGIRNLKGTENRTVEASIPQKTNTVMQSSKIVVLNGETNNVQKNLIAICFNTLKVVWEVWKCVDTHYFSVKWASACYEFCCYGFLTKYLWSLLDIWNLHEICYHKRSPTCKIFLKKRIKYIYQKTPCLSDRWNKKSSKVAINFKYVPYDI